MCYKADEIVTTDGSTSMFTFFCNSRAKITILCRLNTILDKKTYFLLQAKKINFCCVDATLNILATRFPGGVYFYYPTESFLKYAEKNKFEVPIYLKNIDYHKLFSQYFFEWVNFNKNSPIIHKGTTEYFLKKFDYILNSENK